MNIKKNKSCYNIRCHLRCPGLVALFILGALFLECIWEGVTILVSKGNPTIATKNWGWSPDTETVLEVRQKWRNDSDQEFCEQIFVREECVNGGHGFICFWKLWGTAFGSQLPQTLVLKNVNSGFWFQFILLKFFLYARNSVTQQLSTPSGLASAQRVSKVKKSNIKKHKKYDKSCPKSP